MNKKLTEIKAAFGELSARLRRYSAGKPEHVVAEIKSIVELIDECATDFAKAVTEPEP